MNIDKILIPIDFSKTSISALKFAVQIALRFEADLKIVHARLMYEDDPNKLKSGIDALKKEEAQIEKDLLQNMKAPLQDAGKLRVEYEIIRGYSAPSALLGYLNQNQFDLIVMGSHGRSGLDHFLLGSVAEKMVRYGTPPILTVSAKSEPKEKIKKIVIPFDFSKDALYAVRVALELANQPQSELDLIYVVDKDVHPALYAWGVKSVFDAVPDIMQKAMKKMDEQLASLENPAQIKINKVIKAGVIHKEIAAHIKDKSADLLVIATHGRVGIDRFLLGSTSEQLIRSVNLPILTLKQKTLI